MFAPPPGHRSSITAGTAAALALLCVLAGAADVSAASRSSRPPADFAGLLGGEEELIAWELAYAAIAAGASQEAALNEAQELLREVQTRYLEPCFLGRHATCRGNMVRLMDQLRSRLNLTVTQWSLFLPIRNNMFFYRVAPNLRLAVAISKSARDCSGWSAAAKSDGVTLAGLLDAAGQEVAGRNSLPEARELAMLRTRFAGCTAGGGAD